MPTSLLENATTALAALIERDEISLVTDGDELHIAADDWTLVVAGNPPSGILIALDDESGDPATLLAAALMADDIEGLRRFVGLLNGQIRVLLAASPDPLAQALAEILQP